MGAAVAFAVAVLVTILFQLALALGAPWGRVAWGGQNAGALPVRYRIGSAVAALVYGFVGLLALDRGGVLDLVPDAVSQVGMWIVLGLLVLGVVANAVSRSRPERYTMTPVAIVLAVLAFLVALVGPSAG